MADGRAVSLGWTFMEEVPAIDGGGFKMPDNPHFQGVCHNGSITLNASRVTSESNKICGSVDESRGRVAPTELGVRPAGGWGFEFDANQLANGMAEAVWCKSAFRQLAQKSNRAGLNEITSVSGGVITFDGASGFSVGDVVRLSGFTEKGDGLAEVTAVGANTITVPGIEDQAVAGPGALVKLAGKKITGTLNRAAKTLTGFANAANYVGEYEGVDLTRDDFTSVGFSEVEEVDGGTITFSKIPKGFVDGAFSGYAYVGDTYHDGRTRRPIAVEQRFVDDEGGEWYVYFLGLYVSTFQHSGTNTETAQNITGSIEFVGIEAPELRSYTRWPGAVTVPFMESKTFQTGGNVAAVRFNGEALNAANAVTSHNLTVNNNPRVKGAYGTDAGTGVAFGDFTSSTSVGSYLDTPDRYQPLVDGGAIDFDLAFTSADGFTASVSTPSGRYDPGTLNIDGSGDVSMTQPFNAYINKERGYTQQFQLFYGGGTAPVRA